MSKKSTEPIKKLILKREKGITMQIVVKAGFEPNDFEWRIRNSKYTKDVEVSCFVHKSTGLFFIFDYRVIDYKSKTVSRWSIRSPGWHEAEDERFEGGWLSQEGYFFDWLDLLKKEIQTPDVWSDLANTKSFFVKSSASIDTNTLFTKNEQDIIWDRLHTIESQVVEVISAKSAVESHVIETIRGQFDYLGKASARVGRLDWKNLILSTIVGIIISAAFAPDARQEIFYLLLKAFDLFLSSGDLLG